MQYAYRYSMKNIKEIAGNTVEVNFMRLVENEKWQHFLWNVSINGVDFSYKTGIGHLIQWDKKVNMNRYVNPLDALRRLSKSWPAGKRPDNCISLPSINAWVKIPDQLEVLHCLLSDQQAGSMSFVDFCSDFGYDSDSIKAVDIYRACMENAQKVNRCLKNRQEIEKLTENM